MKKIFFIEIFARKWCELKKMRYLCNEFLKGIRFDLKSECFINYLIANLQRFSTDEY